MHLLTKSFKNLILLLIGLVTGIIVSQNETNNWYFGNKSGLSFNNGKLNVLTDGNMNTIAGCSSISDMNGNLLFYTNGASVWNKNHLLMDNGTNLAGDTNNTQTSIIVPKPNNENIFYVFTTRQQPSISPFFTPGVFYSEIEFSTTFPLGKVTIKNIRLTQSSTERITAIHNATTNTINVIAFGSESAQLGTAMDTFFIFNVTENGVIRTPTLSKQQTTVSSAGAMKISPDGQKIAVADYESRTIYLYNFDVETSTITFDKGLLADLFFTPIKPYGVEFSPDSNTLYFSGKNAPNTSYIIKFGFKMPDSDEGKIIVATSSDYDFGSLQLATNGKIYIANYIQNNPLQSIDHISVINNPDDKLDVGFKPLEIKLSTGESFKGLPNFIPSFLRNRIITENKCVSETLNFSLDAYAPIDSVFWEFGDGTTSTLLNPDYQYSNPGTYIIKATISINNHPTYLYKEIEVYSLPQMNANHTLMQCDSDNDGISFFNLTNIEDNISNPKHLNYTFSFYFSMDDALNDLNKISNPEIFENTSNPQELFVKIISPEGCNTIRNFFLETSYSKLGEIQDFYTCASPNDIENSQNGVFNLRHKEDDIRNQFNIPVTSNLKFYSSYQDAQTTTNKLNSNYSSSSSTIWVRIENNDLGCFGIEPIKLIVNTPLELNIEDSYTICDPSLQSTINLDGGISNNSWEWKDKDGNILSTVREFKITKSGKYSLSVNKTENNLECFVTKKFNVYESGIPLIKEIKAENYQISVIVNGTSNYEYSLDNLSFSGEGLNHRFFNVSAGVYTVYIRDKNYCEPTISTKVSLIGFPKYFTPNNDGINDIWQIEGVTKDLYTYANITIFDRYGKYLYGMDLAKNQQGWNGQYNGALLMATDYWFKATFIDKENTIYNKIGHFSLKQ